MGCSRVDFLLRRVAELENILERLEDDSKIQMESATRKLHEKTTEASSLKLENERLKVGVCRVIWPCTCGNTSQFISGIQFIQGSLLMI